MLGEVTTILSLLSAGSSLVKGLFSDPEKEYRKAQEEKIRLAKEAILSVLDRQKADLWRDYQNESARALQIASRQASASGIDPMSMSSQILDKLGSSYLKSRQSLDTQAQNQISTLMAGIDIKPAYAFPHKLDYLSEALGLAGKYFTTKDIMTKQEKYLEAESESRKKLIESLLNLSKNNQQPTG